MTWTISHRQAGVTRGDLGGLIRHNFRDVDRENLREVSHSNERIDPDLTGLNESVLFVNGKAEPLAESSDILSELDERLATVSGVRKKNGVATRQKLRSDVGVVREIVLTLDPSFSRSSAVFIDDQEDGDGEHAATVRGHFQDMINFYGDLYGRENLLAASLHLDETTPHVHLLVTPITEVEGIKTIRQESFIPAGRGSKSGMALNDKAMREWMINRGYDADPEPRRITTKNMTADELDAFERHREDAIALEDKARALDEREKRLDLVAQQQERLQHALEARQSDLKAKEEELPTIRIKARAEAHRAGFRAGQDEGRAVGEQESADLVSHTAAKMHQQSLAHEKKLRDLEEQAQALVTEHVQKQTSVESFASEQPDTAVRYLAYLNEKLPQYNIQAKYDRAVASEWEKRNTRNGSNGLEKPLDLQQFKYMPVREADEERSHKAAQARARFSAFGQQSDPQSKNPGYQPGF